MTIIFILRGLFSFVLLLALYWGLEAQARSKAALALLGVWAVVALGELLISLRLAGDERLASLRGPALAISTVALPVYVAFVFSEVANQVPGLWSGLGSVFGLVERVFLSLILLWMLLVALRLWAVTADRNSAS